MPNYALVDGGAVGNIIRADPAFAAHIADQHQAVVDVTGKSVKIGDSYAAGLFVSRLSDETVAVGARLTLAANANGLGTLTYQWKKDGSPIGGATSPAYSVAEAAGGDAGSYTCDVTDGTSTVTSAAAAVTVS